MGPVSQEPRPKRLERPPIQLYKSEPSPPTPAPEPEKPKEEKSRTVSQFTESALDDIWETAKSVIAIFPEMARLGIQAVKDPSQYGKDLTKVFTTKAGKEAMKEFGWGLVPFSQVIREGPGVLKTKPFSAGVVEAVAALPIVGGMIKSTGMIAKASGAGAKAERLIQIGLKIEQLPAKLARLAVDKTVGKAAKVFGGEWDLPKRREALDTYADVKGMEGITADARLDRYRGALSKLTKDEQAEFTARAYGGLGEKDIASPKVTEALKVHEAIVKEMSSEFSGRREMLSAGRQEGALFKKFAAERGFDIDDVAQLAKAKEAWALLKEKPIYLRHLRLKEDPNALEFVLEGGPPLAKRSGGSKVGALERFTGKGEAYERSPLKIVHRMVQEHAETMTRMKWIEALRGNEKLVTGAAGAAPLTYEGVLQKYFPDKVRAEGLNHITDPTIKRLIEWEFAKKPSGIPGGLLRIYDKLQSVFAKMATKWRPSYHIGNAYSNSLMMALFGGDPIMAVRLGKMSMPARVQARASLTAGELGRASSKLERFADIATGADALARAGIISARTAADLKRAGYSAEQAFKMLPDILKSTDEFTKLQSELTLVRDTIARRTPQVAKADRIIARMMAKEQALKRAVNVGNRVNFGESKAASDLWDLQQKMNLMETKRQGLIGDLTSDAIKKAELEGRLPELKPMVDMVRKNITYANAFIGEYLALDNFERAVMRRLVPFYPWVRAMSLLAFRMPFIAPVKTFMWHRFNEMLQDVAEDPDMPPRMKGYIPVGVTDSGKTIWVNTTAYSPFNSLKTTRVAGIPLPSIANLVEKNPLISLAFSFHGGKTVWNVGNIPFGEGVVSVADGSYARFGQDGRLHEEIPQSPLIQSLVNYFPLTQYAKSVLQPWWTNRFNGVGWPQPILDSDGNPRYPREAIERIGAFVGVPFIARTKEELEKQERMRVMKIIKNLSPAYAKGDAEERAAIKMYIEDYKKGEYRHIAPR